MYLKTSKKNNPIKSSTPLTYEKLQVMLSTNYQLETTSKGYGSVHPTPKARPPVDNGKFGIMV